MDEEFSLNKMTEEDAREILAWRYDEPYDFYNPSADDLEKDVQTLVEPDNLYLAWRDADDVLIGFFCFGAKAQVSGGDYSENALDLGGASRPDLLGTGLGKMFMRISMNIGDAFFRPERYRTTIPEFNARALRMCEKAGFVQTQQFTREDGAEFVVLTKTFDAAKDPGAVVATSSSNGEQQG